METSGLDLTKLTLDDIINAMRINGLRSIQLDMSISGRKVNDPYHAKIVEWYGAVTKITEK